MRGIADAESAGGHATAGVMTNRLGMRRQLLAGGLATAVVRQVQAIIDWVVGGLAWGGANYAN